MQTFVTSHGGRFSAQSLSLYLSEHFTQLLFMHCSIITTIHTSGSLPRLFFPRMIVCQANIPLVTSPFKILSSSTNSLCWHLCAIYVAMTNNSCTCKGNKNGA